MTAFTLLVDGAEHRVDLGVEGDALMVAPDDLAHATGWRLEPEGLCRGDVCVPLRAPLDTASGRVDLHAVADALRRPLAVDLDTACAAMAASSFERGEPLAGGRAPDFTLPDLDGRRHSLSEQRGRKVLLLAYASW